MTIQLSSHRTKSQRVAIRDLSEASQKFQAWRDENWLGASDLKRSSGTVLEGSRVIAYVSYNGRVWNTDHTAILQEASRA